MNVNLCDQCDATIPLGGGISVSDNDSHDFTYKNREGIAFVISSENLDFCSWVCIGEYAKTREMAVRGA